MTERIKLFLSTDAASLEQHVNDYLAQSEGLLLLSLTVTQTQQANGLIFVATLYYQPSPFLAAGRHTEEKAE